jgi:hypothetical protein
MSFPDPYAQPYSKPSDAVPNYQPNPYPYPLQPQPGTVPSYPQGPYPPQQPGAMPYYPPQGAYPPAMPYGAPPYANMMVQRNPRATRAMTYGFIAIAWSLFTFFLAVGGYIGLGGIITGTFAVIYGFQGLNWAKRLPNNDGRGKSLTGVILGFIALGIVVIAFLIDLGNGMF